MTYKTEHFISDNMGKVIINKFTRNKPNTWEGKTLNPEFKDMPSDGSFPTDFWNYRVNPITGWEKDFVSYDRRKFTSDFNGRILTKEIY